MLKLFSILVLIIALNTSCNKKAQQQSKPNVLLLYMDDLRPELGCYGANQIQSPNIDLLAKNSVVFNNAYCNVAVCGASRASMMTGMRPAKNYFKNPFTFIQEEQPNTTTLPLLFKQNGYTTISNGKIYHHVDDRTNDWDEIYRPYAFAKNYTEKDIDTSLVPTKYWQALWKDYKLPKNIKAYAETDNGPAYEKAPVNDSVYIDGVMTNKVIRDLKRLKNSNKPFFLTAGFISNHLPFNAPLEQWEKYNPENIHQPENNYIPKNAPKTSISKWGEMRAYTDIPKKGPVTSKKAKELIHGYYATVSYVDALIGKILEELKNTGLDKNTIVILVADHGYNLEEHTQWAKFTSYDTSTRVPLMIHVPNQKAGTTNALIELVDVYPTLADLCNLQTPNNQLEGKSLVPILQDKSLKGKDFIMMKNHNGYTIKTPDYAYTEFINLETGKEITRMLYDHQIDKEENVNVSEEPEYKAVVDKLHQILRTEFSDNIQ
ncbi:sulfatase [Wenyingzhuangia fucanilytica]|nr:sulfatase [Wenyingzhuangia fucanilytica]